MSSVLGMDLGNRQKSTGPFKRSGLAEILEMDDLNEAAIDNDLIKLGVTDDAIKANRDAIAKVIKAMYLLGGGNTKSTSQTQSKPISSDVKIVNKIVNANSSLKSAIERIDTEQELISLLTDISTYINKDFTKTQSNVVSTFNSIKTDLPKFYSNKGNQYYSNDTYGNVREAEAPTPMDTKNVETKINQIAGLKDALNRINTRDEFRDFILDTILANINPKLAQDKSKMINIMSRMISILSSANLK